MLAATFRASFRPLNDGIMSGRIRGVVADVGCNNRAPLRCHAQLSRARVLKNDVLVVETGCGALASAKMGYLLGDAAMEYAGPACAKSAKRGHPAGAARRLVRG